MTTAPLIRYQTGTAETPGILAEVRAAGSILDMKTDAPVYGVTISFVDAEGNFLGQKLTLDDTSNQYSVFTYRPDEIFVLFQKHGYRDVLVQFNSLLETPTIGMEKTEGGRVVLAVILLALIAFALKKKQAVGKVTTGDVIPFLVIGAGLLAFDLIKEILVFLGIWDSKDTKELDQEAGDPGSPWSPSFWQNKPSNISWTYVITADQADDYAKQIYNAFGWFNDNEEQAIGVFRQLRTQANASFVADRFQQRYHEDLLKFLRGGWWPQDRLSDADVNEINSYLNRLPKY